MYIYDCAVLLLRGSTGGVHRALPALDTKWLFIRFEFGGFLSYKKKGGEE